MSECPFKLPLKSKRIGTLHSGDAVYTAQDAVEASVETTKEKVDYIVLAVNSHEKLMRIQEISYEAICTGDQEASDKSIGLIEDFGEALAEAEEKE